MKRNTESVDIVFAVIMVPQLPLVQMTCKRGFLDRQIPIFFYIHLKNGRCVTTSQKLRSVEPSLSTLYIYIYIMFCGASISEKKVLPNTSCHFPLFWRSCFKGELFLISISKVIRLSQKLMGPKPTIPTLCLGFVGRRHQKKYC